MCKSSIVSLVRAKRDAGLEVRLKAQSSIERFHE